MTNADNANVVDHGATATFSMPNEVIGRISCDLAAPWKFGIVPPWPKFTAKVECEGGEIEIYNYVMPSIYHWIRVRTKDGRRERIEKAYTFVEREGRVRGEPWWSTYRYQLEAFVDKVKGREPHSWLPGDDSIINMQVIEDVYAKSGLGSRPKSEFVLL